jgi:hypothetical protein
MRDDDLDRILYKEQEIMPSSAFVASVMDAVRREKMAPPPIPFPWKRALPGLFAAGITLVSVLVAGRTLFIHETATHPLPVQLPSTFAVILAGWNSLGASWIAVALVTSVASVKLSMHFATRKRLIG